MSGPRPDYIADRIALETYKARHRREAPQACQCIFCLDAKAIERILAERIAQHRAEIGEPPY